MRRCRGNLGSVPSRLEFDQQPHSGRFQSMRGSNRRWGSARSGWVRTTWGRLRPFGGWARRNPGCCRPLEGWNRPSLGGARPNLGWARPSSLRIRPETGRRRRNGGARVWPNEANFGLKLAKDGRHRPLLGEFDRLTCGKHSNMSLGHHRGQSWSIFAASVGALESVAELFSSDVRVIHRRLVRPPWMLWFRKVMQFECFEVSLRPPVTSTVCCCPLRLCGHSGVL